ncbi:MAG: tubulin-like doman-containing protein, partial [Ktedonobacterales bacterium]
MERDKLLSQVSRTIAEPRIKTPALVIMLGSTPAKAGLELSRHLLTLTPTDLRRVSLVYIDTDEKPGPQIEFYQEHAGELQVFDLHIAVPAGISYSTPLPPDRLEHTFIPPKVPQYFANGAGGIRNNGHIAAAYNHQRIVQTIESALGALERLGTDQNERQLSEMQVNIVAFLGGGTGSGILPDVAVMVREILLSRQYLQRINLFCMLPEHIRGATVNDVSWRKSNAAACLLELLALSHVAGVQQGSYTKWLLNNGYHLTDDPIANEVYLVGRTAMGNDEDSARIVGIDLFQRIADASGVGSLEHSTWVNRRTLGATDDKQLFTMFGTSCPLEVRFPAEETAAAFAQVSASYLLPLLIDFHPEIPAVEDGDRLRWRQDWTRVARFTDATADDKFAVPPQLEFGEDEFFQASLDSLDLLWDRLRRANHTIDEQIERAILMKRREEERKISATPPPASAGDLSPLSRRVRHLRMLEQEYAFVLDVLRANPVEDVPSRPRDAEAKLIQPFVIPLPQMVEGPAMRNQARKVCGEYNFILQAHRDATRYNKLLTLVTDLLRQAQAAAGEALAWLRDTGSGRSEEELRSAGLLSPAWQGRLDPPHPHLRHIFDLRSLRRVDGGSIAVERLYWWATASKTSATGEPFSYDQLVGFGKPLDIDKFAGYQKPFDFNSFAAPCIAYLSMHA